MDRWCQSRKGVQLARRSWATTCCSREGQRGGGGFAPCAPTTEGHGRFCVYLLGIWE